MNTRCAHALEDAVAEEDAVVAEGCQMRHTSAYLSTYERICSRGGAAETEARHQKKKSRQVSPYFSSCTGCGGKKRARCPLEKA